MDYGELLYKAHENNKNAVHKEVRCYKTEFSPPKKLERKVSSVNIKKFLARKEEEEKKKMDEAKKKKEELLALRSQDKKATKRVQTMLRSTKSANKSVMEDAVDNVNTADTLNGFFGDTDDYGYTSQESAAFYSKLLNKYENMPPEPPKFEPAKKEVKDLKAAKDRVKAALQREAEEELLPHKRKKRKHDSKENDEEQNNMKLDSRGDDVKEKERNENKKEGKPKPKKPMPPPMKFDQLLQIAQKKQFEPIVIDESLLKKEPERLLTKKQKLEAEKEAQCRRAKLLGQKVPDSSKKSDDALKKPESGQKIDSQSKPSKLTPKTEKLEKKKNDGSSKTNSELPQKSDKKGLPKGSLNGSKQSNKTGSVPTSTKGSLPVKQVPKFDRSGSVEQKSVRPEPNSQKPSKTKKVDSLEREIQLMRERQEFLTKKLKEKEMAMKKMEEERKKEREKPIAKPREMEKKPVKKPVLEKKKSVPVPKKRQILSDSEEEYDSELDDFIDDGPEEGNDYSKYISEIFGYDKSKYSKVDEEDDDECMESNFAQISKEEYVSTKIGIMEDLEDIRKEQEEKRRLKEKKLKKLAESRKKMRCK